MYEEPKRRWKWGKNFVEDVFHKKELEDVSRDNQKANQKTGEQT